MRRRVAAVLAILFGLTGFPAAPALAAGKTALVIGITQFPSTLHPLIDAMLAKTYVLEMTRRPFTAYDKNWELVCLLCTELPSFENGKAVKETTPDGKQGVATTYTIQPDARWGDGTPLSTEDVLFTWEVGRHPQSGVAAAEFYRRAYRIDVHDAKTFTIHTDKLTFDYAAINNFEPLPAHLERDKFAVPAEYKNRTTYDTDPTNKGLYFGPYRVAEFVSGSYFVLVPNETWYGDPPYFQRITVRVIENTAALEANLLSGNVDYIAGELGLTIDQALAFEKRHGQDFDVVYNPGLIYEHLDVNLDNPILADKRVRQALLYALDREAINQRLFGGRQPVAHTAVNPLDWVYADDVTHYPYDPERAAALLDEAGWGTLKGGVRHNAKGEPLTLELMTTAGNRNRELVQQVLQSQWRQVGIDVRIRNEPARVFFGQTVTQRKFTGLAMFAWISAPEAVPRTTLHSAEIPTPENNYSGQNYTGFKNAEMDDLIDAIEVELDRDKRRALWHRLQEIYAEELPALPLYFRANPYILPKWLKGVEPTGHQDTSALGVEHWHAE
jgi:peptide/nickel transport system substrate-binding protein